MKRCGLAVLVACGVFGSVVSSALALPEGRHYEVVSPEYKGGYGVLNLLATAMRGGGEGEGLVFNSAGHFAGQPVGALTGSYVATRGSSRWLTSPLLPPPALVASSVLNDISPTLQGLYYGSSGPNNLAAEQEGTISFFYHDLLAPDGESDFLMPEGEPGFGVELTRLNKKPWPLLGGQSADPGFCTVVFEGDGTEGAASNYEEGLKALLPEAKTAHEQIYELATGAPGCGSERTLRLVAVNNHVKPNGMHELIEPGCFSISGGNINAVTAGGSEVFFTPCLESESSASQLFVRLAGTRTLEVSRPLEAAKPFGGCVGKNIAGEVPCAGAETRAGAQFQGANEAGTRVFFTTEAPLVSEDKDSSSDLYMARIGCPADEPECEADKREVLSLTLVSHDLVAGEAAEVQGTSTALAENGERVYFVAHGVLSGANAEGNVPLKGAENLYVYDLAEGAGPEGATTHFVADLCSGPQKSGEAFDRRCPSNLDESGREDDGLWSLENREAQTTGDGSFLLFASYGRLTADDTDTARDVYRYDAQNETLERVSVSEEGYDANGNDDAFNAEIPLRRFGQAQANDEQGSRAISEDGSRIVFETAEPLSSAAVNHLTNAYEWHRQPGWSEGRVALVSTGSDEEPVGEELGGSHLIKEIMITPSGRDIFFLTTQGLVPQDTDGAEDVYDARLGEGFPAKPTTSKECEGDACQGPLTNPAPLLVPGSVVQAPGENLVVPSERKTSVKCAKGKKLSKGKCVKIASVKCAKGKKLSRGKCVKLEKNAKKSRRARDERGAGR